MTAEELENVYELLAQTIDALPQEEEAAFLARLALVLANQCESVEVVESAIQTAKQAADH